MKIISENYLNAELDRQEEALDFYFDSLLKTKNATDTRSPESKKTDKKETPDWVSENIKCLTVVIAGLKVLIPAMMISQILNVSSRLKPSSHMPSWVYEFSDGDDENIQVINTRKLIFDGLKSQRLKLGTKTYAILIDDGAWGIACDSIGEIVNLKSKHILWRSQTSKRRWLSGTSKAHNAIIFDVRHIEKVLVRFF